MKGPVSVFITVLNFYTVYLKVINTLIIDFTIVVKMNQYIHLEKTWIRLNDMR